MTESQHPRMPGLQGAGLTGFRGCRTGVQGSDRGTRVQGYRVTGVQGSKVTGFQGHKFTGFQGHRVKGYRVTGPQGPGDPRVQG